MVNNSVLLIGLGDWSQFGLLAVSGGGLISPKLALGILSITFSTVFLIQHFQYYQSSNLKKKRVVLQKKV